MKIKKSIVYYIIIAFLLVYILLLDSSSFLQRYGIGKEMDGIKDDIEFIKQENLRLEMENEKLKNDAATWEKKARELGMQQKGDEIFRFRKKEDID